ncbi:MAG: sigma-70 family RNA polymerase sigma factor [Gemmataceae bacterium]|nr:sigma-70 family RNA polymerase sigma factor [Gemmataceae bacterium]MCI0741846.1 sigma-70 family RNA polymerase sigma factor [Gemmataceae bacterium]
MASARVRAVVRRLGQTAFDAALSDAQLLERFLAEREEAAFAALVRRHGPMVLGVCRRVLRDLHDADDAFQATFLVLIKKADVILPRERVGPWLYGVAFRTALKAKAMKDRRRAKQQPLHDVPGATDAPNAEWLALLDREINRLPEKYRLPIVLCDLEGKTRKQAARQLGCPEGTVATRLQHGRALVQKRLARRGVTLAAGAWAPVCVEAASAGVVSTPLVSATVKTAFLFAAGRAAGLIPLNVFALAKGVLRAMVLNKIKNVSAVLLLVVVLGLGLGGLTGGAGTQAGAQPPAENSRVTGDALLEKNDGRLPTGPAPMQALVSLDKGKVIVVKTNEPVVQPRQAFAGQRQIVTYYEYVHMLRTDRYDRSQVEVYDTRLRKLDAKDMSKWLKSETAALVVFGSRDIDPLHMRLIKEGTLVFVLPARPVTPPTIPAHAGPIPPITELPPPPTIPAPSGPIPPTTEVPLGRLPTTPAPNVEQAPQFTTPLREKEGARGDEAQRHLATAEFYLRSGHLASARFYYELVQRRFPGTPTARTAADFLSKLPDAKPPQKKGDYLIGEIQILGNHRVPDTVILDNLPLYPGQVYDDKDVRAAEEKIAAMKEFVNASPIVKLRPTLTVVNSRHDGPYKNIVVMVHEALRLDVLEEMKKLEGTWAVTALTFEGKKLPNHMMETEFIFAGNRLTHKQKHSTSRCTITLDPAAQPKKMRLMPLDGQPNTVNLVGTYELDGDSLRLSIAGADHSGPKTEMTLQRKK